MSRIFVSAFAVLAVFAMSVAAQGDLKDLQDRQKAAAQKLKSQVEDTLDRSRQLERTDSIEAKTVVRLMIRRVEDSNDLLPSERTRLVQQLQIRLNQIDENVRARKIKDDQRPIANPPRTKEPVGNPGGASNTAKGFIDSAKGAQKSAADLIREREKNIVRVNQGNEKSFVPPTGNDIDFPAGWKELSKRRLEMISPKLTDKEVALLKALNSVMSPNYDAEDFSGVLNHIRDKTGLTIIVDEASMQEAGSDYKDKITFKAGKITVRTILKKVLGDQKLTYIIKEGAIQVMTPKKASEYTVIRTYQIDDLIAPNPQTALMFGPFVPQAQMNANAQTLMNLIQATVEPSYWQPNGPGSITFFPPTRSLIIRASTEMHYQLASPGLFGAR